MNKITLLDCTLRDGGYVNHWKFGEKKIRKIIDKMGRTGVEVIECGYLSLKNSDDPDLARYPSVKDMYQVLPKEISPAQSYALMINFGEFPAENIVPAEDPVPIIRVAFHKKDKDEALAYCDTLIQNGYRVFVQPMGALNYTDEEYIALIKEAGKIHPEAFYIVDSFGVMELEDFRRLLFLTDNNLAPEILLGYHSHNNLQQAYSNSKYIVEQNIRHDVVIDASVFGMGRGAGNLNIELFARYLNKQYGKDYDIEPILEVFDECLKSIFTTDFWGYSLPFYLSAVHNCHPDYAIWFSDKNTLAVKSMHELLGSISDEDKLRFDVEKANRYYSDFMGNWVDDAHSLKVLEEKTAGRKVLILAPGKTLATHREEIEKFIQENDPVVFGINTSSEMYHYDYLFISNEKRFKDVKPENVDTFLLTSNLRPENEDGSKLIVNYSSYLNTDDIVGDDPTLMLIKVLMGLSVKHVYLAGFDGFSARPEDNYFQVGISLGSNVRAKLRKNGRIKTQVERIGSRIDLNFITPSHYIEDGNDQA